MKRRDWWKNFWQNDGRRLLWTIFWNIYKNYARLLGSVVAEDWKLLVRYSRKHQRLQQPCSEPGRRSPDVSNIATDCQKKNRYPSFISCPYNLTWDDLREITPQVCEKNDARRSYPTPKQTVSIVCYKINLSWYRVSSKLASYTCERWRLIACSVCQNCGYWSVFVEVIWKYNRGPVFFGTTV